MDKKIRVLHIVANGTLSGAEKVVSDICTNLHKERFAPFAVCSGEDLKNYYSQRGIETSIIDVNSLRPDKINVLRNLIKKNNIDLVHGHDVKSSIAGHLAAASLKIPVISHIHASYPWLQKTGTLKIIDGFFRNKYSLSIACSQMAMDYYLQHNKKVKANNIVYLNNSFNFNEFESVNIKEGGALKKELGISDDTFIYGFLGRLLEGKGADLLIESFYELQKKREKIFLLIVGDGPERLKLNAMINNYNLSSKVKFMGFQKNPYDFLNIFHCFILPSVTEGLPIAVLEAMAMKKTVISTPVAGLKNLMKNGYNGLVLENRSKEELIAAMDKLYCDKNFNIRLAENAYSYIYENYHINNYIKKLEEYYLQQLS
jgi:glycosyltransferase involved in cell wall biosynthesis